jgi:hypothetical protein
MQSNLSNVEQRVKRYWFSDGIGELIGGAMCVLLGLFFAAPEFLGRDSLLSEIVQGSFGLFMIVGIFVGRRLIHTLKARLTYPRTGFVEYQVNEGEMRVRRIWAMVLAFAISAMALVFVRLFPVLDALVAVTGLAGAFIFVVLRTKSAGLARFYLLAIFSLLFGFALSMAGLPRAYGLGLLYGLVGVSLLISGGLTLRTYLKENPLPAEAER